MRDGEALWTTAAGVLSSQVSEAVWLSTFREVRPSGLDGDRLYLTVPSLMAKERIETRYRELLSGALADAGHVDLEVVLEVVPVEEALDDLEVDLDELLPAAPPANPPAPVGGGLPPPADAVADGPGVNTKYTFEAFVTGASNRFAHAAALAVAETPARSYNPLFIYGDAGLGKTHLLQAIVHYVHRHYPGHSVRYLSTEALMNEFVDAIRNQSMPAFKRRYRDIDVLLVDDIQFLEQFERLQEEFFHTFNTLYEANRQIVLSSDRPPDKISTLEDRLRSRFKMGLITDIQPPDFETRLAILRKKAEYEQTSVPNDVLAFIGTHITNNIRELEGALIRVVAYAKLNGEQLSKELAEQVLSAFLTGSQPRAITPELILEATARKYNFTIEELQSRSRRRPLVTARQVGMYVFRELTDLSYPQIAKEFGGRDHTTVIHAYEKISKLMKERRSIFDDVTSLIQEVRTGSGAG